MSTSSAPVHNLDALADLVRVARRGAATRDIDPRAGWLGKRARGMTIFVRRRRPSPWTTDRISTKPAIR